MSRGVRWFLVGSAALVTLAGCGRGYHAIMPNASRGGARRRSPASTPAPSRKARASSASSRSRVPACAARIFRSRSRRWAKPRPSAMPRSRCGRPARSPVRAAPQPSRAGRSRSSHIRPARPQLSTAGAADVDRTARRRPAQYPQQTYPQQQVLGAPPSNLQAPPDWQRGGGQPTLQFRAADARSAAPAEEIDNRRIAALCAARARRRADRRKPRGQCRSLCRRSVRRAIRSLPARRRSR